MPRNFLYLAVIAAAIPEAKIIHVQRHPAAVCWSNYQQYFKMDSLDYCYSLEDVCEYYELYDDLMAFWDRSLDDRIYQVNYEQLTKNQEVETRQLMHHLELSWEDGCLAPESNPAIMKTASSVQVRHKVYQGSSERWKHYRPFLNGALDHFDSPR